MPVSKYFKGHGEKVMAGMKKKYGKRAEEVFYRTANKRGMTGSGPFTKAEIDKGFKVCYTSNQLREMDEPMMVRDVMHSHMSKMKEKY